MLVDVAIDQGGCFETSKATTHARTQPTWSTSIVHYCVANMPGAVPRTSTYALNNVTLPFGLALADKGYKAALAENPNFLQGLNVYKGQVTYEAVARDLGYDYVAPADALFRLNPSLGPCTRLHSSAMGLGQAFEGGRSG